MPKERPILLSGPLVRAILEGRKTVTRRPVRPQPQRDGRLWLWKGTAWDDARALVSDRAPVEFCPYGEPGDVLWVRETFLQPVWSSFNAEGGLDEGWEGGRRNIEYVADGAKPGWRTDSFGYRRQLAKRPSIHMPRWASRITLEVTRVRVERVQDITEEDVRREGVEVSFANAWDDTYAKRKGLGWRDNPWVWAVSFRRTAKERNAA